MEGNFFECRPLRIKRAAVFEAVDADAAPVSVQDKRSIDVVDGGVPGVDPALCSDRRFSGERAGGDGAGTTLFSDKEASRRALDAAGSINGRSAAVDDDGDALRRYVRRGAGAIVCENSRVVLNI